MSMTENGALSVSQKKIKKVEKDKKDDLDPSQDEFVTKTTSFLDWAYAHRRPLGLLIVIALVVAVAGIFANRYLENKASVESKALAEGLEAAVARVVVPDPEADGEVPESGEDDEALTFESFKARATEALKRWSAVEAETIELKPLADLGKASAHLDLGEYDKAIAAYRAFLGSKAATVDILKAQAVEGLGYALEASGKLEEAKKEFEKLMASSSGETKKMATYQTARLSEKKGEEDAAKKLYKDVLDAYGESEKPSRFDVIFVQARTRLLNLDPKAEVPDLPAGSGNPFEGMDPRLLQQLMQANRGAGAS
jgi:tetratricopeptide (TPR) repeat protein